MAELTDYQKDILIRTALGEARGEGVEGMADVIQVVLNRANSGKFPSDPAKVALQDKQFSTWNSGEGGNNPQNISANSKIYKTAAQALEAVMSGRPDPTGGALYYHTPSVSPAWSDGVNTNGKIERNGHVFYPSYPVPPMDIPNTVGTALSTVPTPPRAVMPPRSTAPTPTAMPRSVQIQRDQNAALNDRLAIAEPDAAPARTAPLKPFDAAVNTPRPNADGSISTEVSRTVQFPDGTWGNVPSLWWGDGSNVRDFGRMDDDQLTSLAQNYEKKANQRFPRYSTLSEAERAAEARSNKGAGTTGPMTRPNIGAMGRPNVDDIYAGILPPRPAARAIPAMPTSVAQSYAGQERTGPVARQAPVPASPYDRVTARLNAQPAIVRLPELPPSTLGQPPATRVVQSVPMPAQAPQVSASDMARGRNGYQTIASIPSVPQPSASDRVRGSNGYQTIASIPSRPQSYVARDEARSPQRVAGFAGGSQSPFVPGFVPPITSLPELDGFDIANKDQSRLVAGQYPMAPGGIMPPAFNAPPMPFARPTRATALPPMPRERPQYSRSLLGQPQIFAPRPIASNRQPLRVVVNGGSQGGSGQSSSGTGNGAPRREGFDGALQDVFNREGAREYVQTSDGGIWR